MDEVKTVHYVSKDPIQNLKIKVTLTRLSVQRTKAQLTTQAVSVSYCWLHAASATRLGAVQHCTFRSCFAGCNGRALTAGAASGPAT